MEEENLLFVLSSPFCLVIPFFSFYFGLLRKKDMSWTKGFKRQNPKCWNGLNFNVGGLTLQASIKCYLAWIVKENGKEQHRLELYSCIAEMYDSIGNKWKHAVWLDQQSQRYAIQHLSLREETQHSCIKCCMDCLATIVDFLNNRSL